jgi:hypothetical protein
VTDMGLMTDVESMSVIHFNSMKFCKMRWMTFVTHTEDLRRKWQDNAKIDVIETVSVCVWISASDRLL